MTAGKTNTKSFGNRKEKLRKHALGSNLGKTQKKPKAKSFSYSRKKVSPVQMNGNSLFVFFIVNTVLLLRCLSHSRKQLHRVLVNFTPLDAAHDWELWVFCKC